MKDSCDFVTHWRVNVNHAVPALLSVLCVLLSTLQSAYAQDQTAASKVQVHVVITNGTLREDAELPNLQKEDVKVKQGKDFLPVTQVSELWNSELLAADNVWVAAAEK